MKKPHSHRLLLIVFLFTLDPVFGAELLNNGDFEIGKPEDDKPPSFNCKAWRRQLWRETAFNSWLTDGVHDWQVGDGNQAIEFRWGATSIYQYFTAVPGENYRFSVDFFNPGTTENRWQPRTQVEWFAVDGKPLGKTVTVAEANNTVAPVRKWNTLRGTATAPPKTAYARVLLNVNNKGFGAFFQKMFLDNASVQGKPGSRNLPVSFICAPYDMTLAPVFESTPYRDSLTHYADDKDGDQLTFTKVRGPAWLTVSADGAMRGTPRFADAGANKLVVTVEDGRGSSDTRTLTIPVVGFLRLANLFDDDMVLQRGAPIPVWGKAVPSTPVQVRMSTGGSAATSSDANGAWSLVLPPMPASTGLSVSMTVSSGPRELRLGNLLVGDVWFCSGQSNMALPLRHTEGSRKEIATANHPKLRLLQTPETIAKTPWADLHARARWHPCTPETAKEFSAVAYYFGKKLQTDIGVPIGLINSSQGGSVIEGWTRTLPRAGARSFYNSRVHPYTRLPIKGVIWYQGEANIRDGRRYTAKMQALVRDWRAAWKQGDFPFYFVQLPPFDYKGDAVYNLPELWAAQTAAMRLIPNSGMVVTNDVGDLKTIHPRNKAPVGERLALWAEFGAYGRTNLAHTGPMSSKVIRQGRRLRILFKHGTGELAARDGKPLTWFEVAGADKAFVPAVATIDGQTVVVSAPAVLDPEWVRFAWNETAQPNLMNNEGLPAGAFMMRCDTPRPAGK